MTRKLVSLVLALVMLLSASALAEGSVTYPISEEKILLEYWCTMHSSALNHITNNDESEAWNAVQDATGVDLTFFHPTAGQEKVDFQLTVSDPKTMPDIIQYDSIASNYEGGLIGALEDGVIVDLTDLLPVYAPDYWALVKDNPLFQTADGRYAAIYKTQFYEVDPDWVDIITRADYLEEYGKDTPDTVAELEDYFQWVLDNKPGVVPLALPYATSSTWFRLTGGFNFIFDWYRDGEGKVHYGYADESYKNYLEVLNRWWNKGFLAPDYTTWVEADYKGGYLAGKYATMLGNSSEMWRLTRETEFKSMKLPYLHSEADGMFHFGPAGNENGGNPAVITTNCDNVEAALKFLNYAYTEEGSTLYNYGVKDLSWVYDENGKKVFTDHMMKNEDGMTPAEANYILRIHFAPKNRASDFDSNPGTISGGQDLIDYRFMYSDDPMMDNAWRLPVGMSLTADETLERADIMTDLTTYAKEQRVLFVNGTRSLDTWDEYIEELNEMGMERALEITQAAYDRCPTK